MSIDRESYIQMNVVHVKFKNSSHLIQGWVLTNSAAFYFDFPLWYLSEPNISHDISFKMHTESSYNRFLRNIGKS